MTSVGITRDMGGFGVLGSGVAVLWDCRGQHWSHSCALTRLQCSIVHSMVARGLASAVLSSIIGARAQLKLVGVERSVN